MAAGHRGSDSALPRIAALRLLTVVAALGFAGPARGQVQGYPVENPATPPKLADVISVSGTAPVPPDACGPGHPCGDDPLAAPRAGAAFPRTLLWEPPLASLREPRFLAMPTTFSNGSTDHTAETSIGGTVGLLRVAPPRWKTAFQFDVFAVVHSRFSDYDALVTTDYRAGFPVSFARGPWHGKVAYEHTSTHLGDEIQALTGQVPFDFIKDELVFGLGRYLFDRRWRVYGQVAWAFNQSIPGDPSPFRFGVGTEWVRRHATGWWGSPFAATNLDFDGAVDYDPSFSLQAGWMWRDPSRRLAQCRLFGQYYTGHSPYGQFFRSREDWFGLGMAIDY
jgi:hypothetical protein